MASEDFSTFFDMLPIGAYRATPEGRYLRANSALVRLHGYPTETAMLMAVNNTAADWYVQPGRRNAFKSLLQTHRKVVNFVSEVYRPKTRERIWISEHAHLVCDAFGKPLFYEGTVEDITGRHLAENQQETSERFRSLIHTIPDMVWLKDANGTYLACNAAFEHHFGATAEHIIGKTDADFVGNDMARQLGWTDKVVLQSGRPASFEEEITTAMSTDAGTFEIIKAPMRNAAGELTGVFGMGRDITRRKHAEGLLRDTSEQFELAIISAELGMWAQSFTQTQAYNLDARAQAMLGLTDLGVDESSSWTDRVHPDDLPNAINEMKQHLENQTPFFEAEYRAQHKDGHWIWLSSRGKVVQTSTLGEPLRMVGTLMDITARKTAEEAIRQMAFQDVLTGLPNRRMLMDRLHQALTASVRHKRCGALLFLDLDKFKQLNDTMGHDVGDLLLQQVAARIQNSVRAVDTVARMGGDEFVVLIADLGENPFEAQANAATVGQKILSALNEPYHLGEHRHVSTPSIGATLFAGLSQTPSAVLKQADMAMYQAKATGSDKLRFYEESLAST